MSHAAATRILRTLARRGKEGTVTRLALIDILEDEALTDRGLRHLKAQGLIRNVGSLRDAVYAPAKWPLPERSLPKKIVRNPPARVRGPEPWMEGYEINRLFRDGFGPPDPSLPRRRYYAGRLIASKAA